MPVVAGVLWPADSCVGIVESRLQCLTIHHYTLSLPLCSAAAFFPPDHWPLDRTLTTGVEKLSQLKLLPPAACLLLTEKWIIMTDIRQQRQVLRKCGGGSRGSVRKESKGMETRKSETHAAIAAIICNISHDQATRHSLSQNLAHKMISPNSTPPNCIYKFIQMIRRSKQTSIYCLIDCV